MKKHLLMWSLFSFAVLTPLVSFGAEQELHWTLCEQDPEDVIEWMDGSDIDDEKRQVSYLDSKEGTYYRHGITLRVRRGKKKSKSTVKVKISEGQVDEKWLQLKGFKCEQDRYGNTVRETCSLTESFSNDWLAAQLNATGFSKLFSKNQKRFLNAYGQLSFPKKTHRIGPVGNQKWEFEAYGLEFDMEEFKVGSRQLLELSTRTDPSAGPSTYRRVLQKLQQLGICVTTPQSKTAWVYQLYGILP